MNTSNNIKELILGRSLEEIAKILQQDYQVLDELVLEHLDGKLIIGSEKSSMQETYPLDVHLIQPPRILHIFSFIPLIYDLLQAFWLLASSDQRTCILVNGGYRFGTLACILNSFLGIQKRKILLAFMYIPDGKVKRWLARRIILGASLTTVWSRKQLNIQSKLLHVPARKFVFIPYKANHSISPPIAVRIDGYIFSGGNTQRDYRTLFDAVRGTNIPVIVSATKPLVCASLNVPENVIVLAAREPSFARLMAASRFVVMPILSGLVRGAGEASVCNAMWHGRPVICADDISAFEYIEDGITGYITPPGDVLKLRERILELWSQPDKAAKMGCAAHQVVTENYTHQHFIRRLRILASIIALSK